MLKSLNVAQTGLNAAKIAVENTSNNIANQNTPGYKKRVTQLSEIDLGAGIAGHGVSAKETYRITSEYMFNNIMRETTKNSYYEEVSFIVGNIEKMFNETDKSGFSKDLNRFFQSVENLRSNPNSEIYKNTLQNDGKLLVDSLQQLYTDIEAQEKITLNRVKDNVVEINSILKEIGELNEQMGRQDGVSNDLLDKRDQLEKDLSKLVNIEVDRSDGQYELKIGNAIAVRHNTNIREVNIVEENIAQIDRFTVIDESTSPDTVYDAIKYDESYNARTYATGDVVTYKFNNEHEVSVTIGESYDFTDDNVSNPVTIDDSNMIRALEHKINTHTYISEKVEAFNGNYNTDENGNKTDETTNDKFLLVEAKNAGEDGGFIGRISIKTAADGNEVVFKGDYQSVEPKDKVYLAVYDSEITLSSGVVKAQTENLTTDSPNNKIIDYKNKLDNFAMTLSDIYDSYVKTGTDEYQYGNVTTDSYNGAKAVKELNLFSGSNVKSLTFNKSVVNNLNQDDLNYMGQMQWKSDIDFDGFAQDASTSAKTSFSEFFQETRVSISSDKENNDFLKESQTAVIESLQFSYDQLTKVDNDEEMINLIQFQAAYTANAKVITVVDEMLQTLLGIKR